MATTTALVAAQVTDAAEPPKRKAFKRQRALEGVLRTYKVRMLVTDAQRQQLKLAFSMARRAYNWTIGCINAGAKTNFGELRKIFFSEPVPEWAQDKKGGHAVHTKFMARAIKQAWDAVQTNWSKWRKNPKHHFKLGFRSLKHSYTEVLILESNPSGTNSSQLRKYEATESTHRDGRAECLVHVGGNISRTGPIRLQDKQRVVDKLVAEGNTPQEDAKIMWDKRTGDFHFVYTYVQSVEPDPDSSFAHKRIASGDMGERDFARWGSPTDGKHGELLTGFRDAIFARCKAIDTMQSRIDKRQLKNSPRPKGYARSARQRYETTRRLRRQLARERRRLHNWVEGAHYDAANYMLRQYDVLIMPKLETARMVQKDDRVFRSKVARSMCTMSFGLFADRLKSAASRYPGRHVLTDTGEPGTSKTCSDCGHWHATLGSSKTFDCPACGICVDRDVNGWRGNLFAAYGKAVGIGWDGRSG